MTIKMESFGFTWTDPGGTRRASAVAYDRVSADRQEKVLKDAGATEVERVPVKPGELPTPKA
ncbi:hypothetical protein SAM23877_p037 (plasmid) [Streptomyces ambofaciens ATCC 23877]|uniref:Uncharacterized protein n=1 Tax=Streptomyces ambofaciens (strain ATCC 23877 / 3486 / DSM 40053 / JCM 4204 / NBRC 12836 / NRRL B-2516) TaxID=278992 RepID=A0A0K2B6E4_STRA7|nr:hypothetical protein [Streptomyces ambofaciens]AKZ60746.1 hypothetical protein SAM23877_p037 [Streptomyces ambofaciens ATCC 23877]